MSSSCTPQIIPLLTTLLSGVLLRSGRYISPGGVPLVVSSVSLSEFSTGSSFHGGTELSPWFRSCSAVLSAIPFFFPC